MSRYTLRVSGEDLEDVRLVLAAAEGVHGAGGGEGAVVVSVDAPSLDEAKARVEALLPEGGSYAVSRPAPLEDDPED